jgi:RimJ/RimL family protein N-acetyltransferase
LRPVESEDVDPIAIFLAHPDLVGRRGLRDDRPMTRSVAAIRAAVASFTDPELGAAWAVEAGGLVGVATTGWWWDARAPWAHVAIDPSHQRQGHGTAAATLVADYLFLETPAVLVEWGVDSWDATGLSFSDALGGDRVGTSRRVGIRGGRYHDRVEYVLTRQTWNSRAAGR